MKLIRWVELHIRGRRSRGKSKDKSKTDQHKSRKCYDISQSVSIDLLERQKEDEEEDEDDDDDGSPSFSRECEKPNACDRPLSSRSNIFHNRTSTHTFTSSCVEQRHMPSSPMPSHTQQSISSSLISTPQSRERSRIKTNPWLRSPWLMRQSYGSSSSTDSGYDCNSQNVINKNNDKNKCYDNMIYNNTYNNSAANESHTETMANKRFIISSANSSSDEFANSTNSSSYSIFSSISSSTANTINNTDMESSKTSLPSQASLSIAIESNQSSPKYLKSKKLFNSLLCTDNNCIDDNCSFSSNSLVTRSIDTPQSYSIPRRDSVAVKNIRDKQRIKKINHILRNATKIPRGTERWISLATEQMSSSEDEYNDRDVYDDRDVPSPAPHDNNTHRFQLFNSSGTMSCRSNRQVPSPAPLDWTMEFNKSDSLDYAHSSDFESLIFTYLNQSSSNDNCSNRNNINDSMTSSIDTDLASRELNPISPQADSAIGLSSELSSTTTSTSTTPSLEIKHSDELGHNRKGSIIDCGRVCDTMPLDEKVRQLTIELRDIVDVAMCEARQEQLQLREGRLQLQRQLIQYKRDLLIQKLARLRP